MNNEDPAEYGAPPRNWAKFVCEILVSDFVISRQFWEQGLGFEMAYQRPEQLFVYLERPDGPQIMLCQRSGNWETGPLDQPYGRGVMFQIYVDALGPILASLERIAHPIQNGPREIWRRWGDREGGKREIVVQDPDGYLVMLAEDLGERPLSFDPPHPCDS